MQLVQVGYGMDTITAKRLGKSLNARDNVTRHINRELCHEICKAKHQMYFRRRGTIYTHEQFLNMSSLQQLSRTPSDSLDARDRYLWVYAERK